MLWQGLQGIEFTKDHYIDLWKEFLAACDTEEADEGCIGGWLITGFGLTSQMLRYS